MKTVVLVKEDEKKGSIRYVTDDPNSPITNIYLSRKFSAVMPPSVTVTIAAIPRD